MSVALSFARNSRATWAQQHQDMFYFCRHELVRSVAGDLVESVTNIDTFTHPKSGRVSHCYRINYRSMDRSLTNEEIDALQETVRAKAAEGLGVELR